MNFDDERRPDEVNEADPDPDDVLLYRRLLKSHGKRVAEEELWERVVKWRVKKSVHLAFEAHRIFYAVIRQANKESGE